MSVVCDLQELLEYFGQEQACYTALLDLSRQQRQHIEAGDLDTLLRILGQKQQLLVKVGEIERHLRPYKESWKSIHRALGEEDRQVLDLALGTVEELLAELIALERESEELLESRRETASAELAEASKGNQAHRAYAGKPAHPSARALDLGSR